MKQAARRARWLVPFLLGALALTVTSFLASTFVAERRARGIEDDALSIATNAMPSVEHLADMRSELRRMEGLVIAYAHGDEGPRGVEDLRLRIRRSRGSMARTWALERETPVYPGETDLWVGIDAATAAFDASLERVLAAAARRDPSAGELIHGSLQPSVDRLAEALLVDLRFNARHAEDLADGIVAARGRQRRLASLLDTASAVFALIAGVAIARLLRGYVAMTDARISELDLFAARVAHDVRSPLLAVGLAIDLARQRRGLEGEALAALDRAARSVQRLGQMVDALLALAGSGTPPPEGARAEILAAASDAIGERAAEARDKGVDLALEPGDPLEVACMPGVLGTVLSNLIGNAIKYIGEGPDRRVRVAAHALDGRVRVEVVDTGPGVPVELRERIFDPYVRATSSSIPGLGLGLATVRRMIEACGGRVGVDPVPAGGSRFWFELPKAAPPPPCPDSSHADSGQKREG